MTSLIDRILEDHQSFREQFPNVTAVEGKEREQRLHELTKDLVMHEVAEEEIVWPEVRAAVPDGDHLADERTEEESQAERMLADLDKMDVMSPDFEATFAKLQAAVLRHAEEEERTVLALLAEAKDRDDLEELGDWWQRAKRLAPTRPHPHAPNTALGNLLGSPVLATVDHLRDAVRAVRTR